MTPEEIRTRYAEICQRQQVASETNDGETMRKISTDHEALRKDCNPHPNWQLFPGGGSCPDCGMMIVSLADPSSN